MNKLYPIIAHFNDKLAKIYKQFAHTKTLEYYNSNIKIVDSRFINNLFKDRTHTHGIAGIIESILVNIGMITSLVPIVKAVN